MHGFASTCGVRLELDQVTRSLLEDISSLTDFSTTFEVSHGSMAYEFTHGIILSVQ